MGHSFSGADLGPAKAGSGHLRTEIGAGLVHWGVGTTTSATCLAFGFVPDRWLAHLIGDPLIWLHSPAPRLVMTGVGVALGIRLVRKWRASAISTATPPPEEPAENDPESGTVVPRMQTPFLEFVFLASQHLELKSGRLDPLSMERFLDRFRWAVCEKKINVYGAKAFGRRAAAEHLGFLVPIPAEFFRNYPIEIDDALIHNRNSRVRTAHPDSEICYADLHVNREQARRWLYGEAARAMRRSLPGEPVRTPSLVSRVARLARLLSF